MRTVNKKMLLVLCALFIGGAWLILFLSSWFTTATLNISSSSNAELFVKQGRQDFQKIGAGKATFKTRDTESVFVEARDKDNVTQKSVQPKRRQTIDVSLELKQPGTAERVSSVGPFLSPFISDQFVYGIFTPTTVGYLNVAPLGGKDTADIQYPSLPSLPILRQIAWQDVNNFIYVTATEGAGVVSTNSALNQSKLPYINVATPNSSTTALLSGKGLHLANGLDIKDAPLVARSESGSWSYVFADNDFIFFGWTRYGQSEEEGNGRTGILRTEPEDPEGRVVVDGVNLSVFDHQGERQHKFDLDIKSRVLRVASVDKSTVGVLADQGAFYLIDLKTGQSQKKDFSFGSVQDMVSFENKFLLLGSAGLWEYDVADDSYHKVAGYPAGESYVPQSLSVSSGALYFSTKNTQRGNIKTRQPSNSVFKVLLND